MTPERLVTDAIYTVLFGADGDTLRQRLGLPAEDTPDDDRLRDEMSERALRYLAAVEHGMTTWLRLEPHATPLAISAAASRIAAWYATDLRASCEREQVDIVTGKPLEGGR